MIMLFLIFNLIVNIAIFNLISLINLFFNYFKPNYFILSFYLFYFFNNNRYPLYYLPESLR